MDFHYFVFLKIRQNTQKLFYNEDILSITLSTEFIKSIDNGFAWLIRIGVKIKIQCPSQGNKYFWKENISFSFLYPNGPAAGLVRRIRIKFKFNPRIRIRNYISNKILLFLIFKCTIGCFGEKDWNQIQCPTQSKK